MGFELWKRRGDDAADEDTTVAIREKDSTDKCLRWSTKAFEEWLAKEGFRIYSDWLDRKVVNE